MESADENPIPDFTVSALSLSYSPGVAWLLFPAAPGHVPDAREASWGRQHFSNKFGREQGAHRQDVCAAGGRRREGGRRPCCGRCAGAAKENCARGGRFEERRLPAFRRWRETGDHAL